MFRQRVRDKEDRQPRPDETCVELPLILTTSQWAALEKEAGYQRQTIGELLRKLIAAHLAERNDCSLPAEANRGEVPAQRTLFLRADRVETCSVEVVPATLPEAGEVERISMLREDSPGEGEVQPPGRMKRPLLAVLGHELRSPFGAILNALHLLRLRDDDAAARAQILDLLERQSLRIARLIETALAFSSVDHSKVLRQPVDLARVVDFALETVRPFIDERRHILEVNLPPEPVTLQADAIKLEQVLINLLTNAARYTEPGGRIWLQAEQVGGGIVFRVPDTGLGISRDEISRIFDPFWRSAGVAGRSDGGLGIGLALVREIVQMHGGEVDAFSPGPGQGTEFVVRLPKTNSMSRRKGARLLDEVSP